MERGLSDQQMPSQQNLIMNEAAATRTAKRSGSRGVLQLTTIKF